MANLIVKKKCIVVSILFVAFLLFNYLTEAIPFSLSKHCTDKTSDITVLCYNIKCKGVGYDEKQLDIAKEILNEAPDVVFLCEFHRSHSKLLDSLIIKDGRYNWCYRPRAYSIIYSKYKIGRLSAIDVGTSQGPYALNNKVYIYTPYGPITVVGCHLSSSRKDILGGYINRKREADSIYKVCMNEQFPLIIMGDLNDLSCSPPVKHLKEAGLKDAWWEGGLGYGATYHDGWLRLRVDHILYDNERLELIDVKVIDNDLSDHNALIAKFKIKKKH